MTGNEKQQSAGETVTYEIKTVTAEELPLFYSVANLTPSPGMQPFISDEDREVELGCIGFLRVNFGYHGNKFHTSWVDHRGELKTQAFKDELDTVVNYLRGDGNMLNSLGSLSEYCYSHPEARLDIMRRDDIYGFRIDTDGYCYYIRGMLTQGDKGAYVYCYQRSRLDQCLGLAPFSFRTEGS